MGFAVLFVAGIFQGSFGLGYKKYQPFSWSVFWGVYNIMCMLSAALFAFVLAPEFISVFAGRGFEKLLVPLLCGAVWGLSTIGFSKGITKIGMSLVYGISMGISTVVGSVTPMIINHSFPTGSAGVIFVLGLFFTLLGVSVVTFAGIKRDGKKKSSVTGILLAVFSGFGSGFMNVGFSFDSEITDVVTSYGYSETSASAIKWLPVLVGGALMCIIYCIIETSVKKEWHTATAPGSVSRTFKLFGVSLIWYSALFLYGVCSAMLGSLGETVGWILFNALALIVSVFWGLKTGEWKGEKKTALFAGCAILIAAWVFIALT